MVELRDGFCEVGRTNLAFFQPFCGDGPASDVSDPALAEGGVIERRRGIKGVGDLPDSFDWSGPVAVITVTNNG